ncbi:hypothetical protein [Propioniciclava coleopterorum]|uniref:hypothetical protein n=1 Tax=Propioniciclava coleopterorum TaxID=2714937 RepID=UPI00197ECBD1|nr:hypothetical protein [Propioniciclava coleopterorum]
MRVGPLGSMAIGALMLAGCTNPSTAAVRSAAEEFQRAPAERACALLAPATFHEVEELGACPDVLAGLPRGTRAGDVTHVEIAGQGAQVRFTGDVVFLASFPGGWRITAAGCRRVSEDPAIPYVCEVEP